MMSWIADLNKTSDSVEIKERWLKEKEIGDVVPDVNFFTQVKNANGLFEWKILNSQDLFSGKRVVVFATPGAFTPTCSIEHLPGYEREYNKIKSYGIDDVYCVSVNDAYVMYKWGLDLGLEKDTKVGSSGFRKVKLIPDGSAHFARGMGMSTTWENRGFGERSWRYSMVVNNGIIEKKFVEPGRTLNSGPDPYGISGVTTMVNYLSTHKKNGLSL